MGFIFLLLHFDFSFSINSSTQPPFQIEPTLHSIFKLNVARTGAHQRGNSEPHFIPSAQHQSFPCAAFLRTSTLGPVARTPLQHNSGCNVHSCAFILCVPKFLLWKHHNYFMDCKSPKEDAYVECTSVCFERVVGFDLWFSSAFFTRGEKNGTVYF